MLYFIKLQLKYYKHGGSKSILKAILKIYVFLYTNKVCIEIDNELIGQSSYDIKFGLMYSK